MVVGRNDERASTMSDFVIVRAVSDPRFGEPTNKAAAADKPHGEVA